MEERRAQVTAALNQVAEKSGTPPAQYNTGDQVWLEGKNLRLPYQATKLAPKRYGPFKIIKEISPVAYQLALPLTWRIHNTFHALLLSPYCETTAHGPNFSRPPPDLINDEEQYEVEQIRNHQYFGHNRTLQYLIHWKGYPDSNDTWEPAADTHALDLVKSYHKGTPLDIIKAGHLSLQTPISLHPGYQPRTSQVGRKPLDTTPDPSMPKLLGISTLSIPIHHPQVLCLLPWTTDPYHSRPRSRTSILLPRTPLHLSFLTASTTPLSTSVTLLPPSCQITPSMPLLNPLEVAPIHPRPATPLVEWKTYSPPTLILTLSPSERSQLVWSRPSRITKRSIALLCLPSRTRSRGLSLPLRGMPKLMNEPQMGMSAVTILGPHPQFSAIFHHFISRSRSLVPHSFPHVPLGPSPNHLTKSPDEPSD